MTDPSAALLPQDWSSLTWPNRVYTQLSVAVLALDLQGRLVALNPAAEAAFARPAAEALGQPLTAMLDHFSHEKAETMLAITLTEGGVQDWELDHLQPGRDPKLIGYTTTLLRDAAGQPIGVGAIGLDLSAKTELSAQLAATNQQLEGALLQLEKAHAQLKATQSQLVQSEKMRALGQMVAGVAHEINNPAAFVANNLAHLEKLAPALLAVFQAYQPLRPLASAETQAILEAAENAAEMDLLWEDLPDLIKESRDGLDRIRQIVLSLRNFARLDEADQKEADINEGLRNTVRLVRPMCRNRVEIVEDYGPLPRVVCHPGELNQVFLNLMTNAIQAITESGQLWITSRATGNNLVISFRDNGVGMNAATLARLGEPFFTTKPVGSGVGLGLAVSYGIIERHHGRIQFESQPGQGTTAIVEIPIHHV